MITVQDYEDAADRYVAALGELEPAIRSVVLYASLARGDIRPGQSDMIDARVVVTKETLDRESEHRKLMETIVTQTRKLCDLPIPHVHAPTYVAEDEFQTMWANGVLQFADPGTSRLALGDDMTREMQEAAQGNAFAGRFFLLRRTLLLSASRALSDREWTSENYPAALQPCCFWYTKYAADFALNELGEARLPSARWQRLGELLPSVDIQKAQALEKTLRKKLRVDGEDMDPSEARRLVRECLEIIEQIHDSLVDRLMPDFTNP